MREAVFVFRALAGTRIYTGRGEVTVTYWLPGLYSQPQRKGNKLHPAALTLSSALILRCSLIRRIRKIQGLNKLPLFEIKRVSYVTIHGPYSARLFVCIMHEKPGVTRRGAMKSELFTTINCVFCSFCAGLSFLIYYCIYDNINDIISV